MSEEIFEFGFSNFDFCWPQRGAKRRKKGPEFRDWVLRLSGLFSGAVLARAELRMTEILRWRSG